MRAHIQALPDCDNEELLRAQAILWEWFLDEVGTKGFPAISPADLGLGRAGDWQACRESLIREIYQGSILARLQDLRDVANSNEPVDPMVRDSLRSMIANRLITEHVRGNPRDSSPGAMGWLLSLLEGWLLAALRNSIGAWSNPSLLGYEHPQWNHEDCLHKATHDCYIFCIFQRRAGLKNASDGGQLVSPLVRLNVINFILDRRRLASPTAYKAYQVVRKAIQSLGLLPAPGGDGIIVLVPGAGEKEPAETETLRRALTNHPGWEGARRNAFGRQQASATWLADLISAMPGAGIHSLRTSDLVGVFREGLREFVGGPVDPKDLEVGKKAQGDLVQEDKPALWLAFDSSSVSAQIEANVKGQVARDNLFRILNYLEGLANDEFMRQGFFVQMAEALGMPRQNLNYYMGILRPILEKCRIYP